MKKRFLLLFVVIALFTVTSLSGCAGLIGGKDSTSGGGNQTLTLNKKYIFSGTVVKNFEERYYVFKDNGKGEYFYYRLNGDSIAKYTVNFKYLLIDDTVVCFFDSLDVDSTNNTEHYVTTTWNTTLGFSKDILMSTGGYIYICEDYLPNIPNFGK